MRANVAIYSNSELRYCHQHPITIEIQNGDILVPANHVHLEKAAVKMERPLSQRRTNMQPAFPSTVIPWPHPDQKLYVLFETAYSWTSILSLRTLGDDLWTHVL